MLDYRSGRGPFAIDRSIDVLGDYATSASKSVWPKARAQSATSSNHSFRGKPLLPLDRSTRNSSWYERSTFTFQTS